MNLTLYLGGKQQMINFVLCDDYLPSLDRLRKMLEKILLSHDINAQIAFSSDKPHDILEYVKNNHVDVVFLDIELKDKISGIELGKMLREINKSIYIIYTTGHIEYALLAYKIITFDYLAKPISMEKLEETVLRLIDDMKNGNKKYLKLGSSNVYVNQSDITYIKKDGMKLIFETTSGCYETYNSFSKLKSCLPANFIQCHKSYIVNTNRISNIELKNNTIVLDNKSECYIGPKYKNQLLEVINYV